MRKVLDSPELLRLVLETLPVGVAVMNQAGDIILINNAAKCIWGGMIDAGRDRWEQTKGYWHITGERVDPKNWASVRALTRGETSLNELIDVETYDGKRKIIRNSAAPVRDVNGTIVGAVIVNEDVTDRVQAEEALRRSEEKFRITFEFSPISCVIVRIRDRRWLNVNATFVATFGFTAEEAIGKTGKELGIWPDEFEREELWQRFLGGKAISSYETRLVTKSGSQLDVLLYVEAIHQFGEPCFLASVIDITERKGAEMEVRTLIDAIPQQIWSGPPDGTNDYVNNRWRAETGLGVEDVRGDGWRTLIHPEDLDCVIKAWDHSVRTGTPYEQEERHRIADGSYRWYINRGVPLRDKEGRIIRWYGSITDIDDRKKADEALREAHQRLRILSRRRAQIQEEERQRLSRELHDQIGQLLTAAKINVQSARKLGDDPAVNNKLNDAARILDSVLQEVRKISFALRPPVLDDLGLAPALRWMLSETAGAAGLAAEFFADSNLNRADSESETACYRVAVEAVTNTIRHAGARKIEMGLRNLDHSIELRVRDDGRGFDVAKIERVPERDRLGLSGMRERTFAVGGQFEIKSEPGHGTEVVAHFPLSSASESMP